MNYRKSLIASVITFGLGFQLNAQKSDFSLNGLGRSVITNNELGGTITTDDETFQQSGISGYNLFDLQTNLDVDSNFNAVAILRAKSPFGSFFGAGTTFEFRQFTMTGDLKGFKYEIGDLYVELSPYTVYNPSVGQGSGYESPIFVNRREILEYENFNMGNAWFVQGVSGQYFHELNNDGMGLGVYAFSSRNTSTNESTIPDRLLSGGNVEFRLNKNIAFGSNIVGLYDITLQEADFDYTNLVYTGYAKFNHESDKMNFSAVLEGGLSDYTFSQYVDQDTILGRTDSSYTDGFVDLTASLVLKDPKIKFDLNVRSVGVLFSSPSAQTRRIFPTQNTQLFSTLSGGVERGQLLFDRFTSEDIYNAKINPELMAFLPYYNNASPYGKATPNRVGGEFGISTDTTNKMVEAGAKFGFFSEIQGEGGEATRSFLVINGGAVGHLGKYMGIKRLFDVNAGIRFEQTSRTEGAQVDLTSMLIDAGISFEVVKRLDLLVGAKFFAASGNEFVAVRNGFNAIEDFDALNIDIAENIVSFGVRARLNKYQTFSLNYNYADFSNELNTDANYNLGQLFLNYTGRF